MTVEDKKAKAVLDALRPLTEFEESVLKSLVDGDAMGDSVSYLTHYVNIGSEEKKTWRDVQRALKFLEKRNAAISYRFPEESFYRWSLPRHLPPEVEGLSATG